MISIIAWLGFISLVIFVIIRSVTSYLEGKSRIKRREVFLVAIHQFVDKDSVHFKRIDAALEEAKLSKDDTRKLYMAIEFLVEDRVFSYKKIDDCYVTNKHALTTNDYNDIQKEVETGLFDKILDGVIPR